MLLTTVWSPFSDTWFCIESYLMGNILHVLCSFWCYSSVLEISVCLTLLLLLQQYLWEFVLVPQPQGISSNISLIPGKWNVLLLNHKFALGLKQDCNFSPFPIWTGVENYLFRPSFGGIWAWSWFYSYRFCQNTRIGYIISWAWYHCLYSLLGVPLLS